MKHPNETGNIQCYKMPLHITIRAHTKKFILRIKNWDAERWYRKYGK